MGKFKMFDLIYVLNGEEISPDEVQKLFGWAWYQKVDWDSSCTFAHDSFETIEYETEHGVLHVKRVERQGKEAKQ